MKVGIAGCGGIGSNVAYHLIRSGIINFKFGDFDIVEISNLNRQFFFHSQIGKAKALCLKENLLQINPKAIIEAEIIHFEKENIQNFFYDCDIIIEAFDKKECKTMLLEEISTTGKPIIAASGIADYDIENLQIKKLSSNLYVVGDFMKGIENYPTYSHKVNMVAAMMAKVVLDLGGYFEKKN
ncbi:sulfur carrier protein ThiS adenylyltransferase ThiF [Fusobacterium gonidiaformans]|uniref:sulfur carrier protein ThiS adenylyltransferase ThiF n=1 Tax=Fusobacterium gonidiaformans TaxID=849 RepID=UPI0001BC645F|nr:sulfur carrier protein ThiS adenylyltransferase ThiF [Fusobacterium gonidiaformans]AVQ16716.1 sulfur carrier protein ThiS adenylyltransferase ThiF [Fusobacterium gonidiaformans ATCC 25563]EFS28290.2 thiamine biosynthesis protein ThiF [Fusobacterium gonidiaformans ATCC 25563]